MVKLSILPLCASTVVSVLGASCSKDEPAPAPAPVAPSARVGEPEESSPPASEPRDRGEKPEEEPSPPEPPARVWGTADLDPDNNDVVAPPDAVPECHTRLEEAGVEFRPSNLPLKQLVKEVPTCGSHDAVVVVKLPEGTKISPPAVMTCQMALGMVGLEEVLQQFAEKELGEKIRTLHQGGTYSCRKMARFNMVSEHSYGNAIDVFSFTTENWRKISVLRHYGKLDAAPESLSKEARFLRAVASAAYDRDIFSVSLSPYWDALHRDHFHFDMARYRVDGTRP